MADPLKILFLSAEVSPFAKRGGLGDVAGSLPKALKEMGHDIRVVMPAYQTIEEGYPGVEPTPHELSIPMGTGFVGAGVFEGYLPGCEVPIYFVAQRDFFNRDEVYGYDDDPYRFAFFSRAALDLAVATLDWRPDIVHANDWHTAAAIAWLATSGQDETAYQDIPTVFTIHNLAHQGIADWHIFDYLDIQTHGLIEESNGQVNFMARGIYHATMINTVSPTYAREILTPEGGAGLDGLLRHRSFDVHGILNGIDYEQWDPMRDPHLAAHFDTTSVENRIHNKRALQNYLDLPQRDDVPLVAMISRLDWQKGLDITEYAVQQLMSGYAGDAQFVVLGTGKEQYEAMFAKLANYYRGKMAAILEYSAELAPLIYGASDLFLMPSLFEPCGLGQMLAMRYGCIPVVRATGGLADTVEDSVTGFTFQQHTAEDFWQALERALNVFYKDKEHWREIQRQGMTTNFSWERSAQGYDQLYRWAISRVRGY